MSEAVDSLKEKGGIGWKLIAGLLLVALSSVALMIAVLFGFMILFLMLFGGVHEDGVDLGGEVSQIGTEEIPAEYIGLSIKLRKVNTGFPRTY